MPAMYAVWLGPEPPDGGEICFRARGHIRTVNSPNKVEMVDGHGHGTKRLISGTVIAVRTTEYLDNLYSSIEFTRRCPSGHRYAGRLYAELDCVEHAAWLWLTMPNGRGGDTNNAPLLKLFLPPVLAPKFERLKQTRFNLRKADEAAVDYVLTGGMEMPPME